MGWAPPVWAPGTVQGVFVDIRQPTSAGIAAAPDSFVLAKQLPAAVARGGHLGVGLWSDHGQLPLPFRTSGSS